MIFLQNYECGFTLFYFYNQSFLYLVVLSDVTKFSYITTSLNNLWLL